MLHRPVHIDIATSMLYTHCRFQLCCSEIQWPNPFAPTHLYLHNNPTPDTAEPTTNLRSEFSQLQRREGTMTLWSELHSRYPSKWGRTWLQWRYSVWVVQLHLMGVFSVFQSSGFIQASVPRIWTPWDQEPWLGVSYDFLMRFPAFLLLVLAWNTMRIFIHGILALLVSNHWKPEEKLKGWSGFLILNKNGTMLQICYLQVHVFGSK